MNPFAQMPSGNRVDALGEVQLLEQIRRWLGDTAPPSPCGMGDDTAVLPPAAANLITTDSLVYGRHFDDSISPELAGAKLLKRNLSDIAAMGGIPLEAVMAGFLPAETSLAWLEAFTRGLADCARTYKVTIAGGDLTQTDGFLGFNLTLLGTAPEPLLRTGAAIGDTLWVTGDLGGSLRGKHAHFTPRLEAGQWLAARGRLEIRALIDLTDGLAKDLPALLPADGAAALEVDELPISADAEATATQSGQPVITHVLTDGEDYELLFATHQRVDAHVFQSEWESSLDLPLNRIGTIVARTSDARLLDASTGRPLDFGNGYEHFTRA